MTNRIIFGVLQFCVVEVSIAFCNHENPSLLYVQRQLMTHEIKSVINSKVYDLNVKNGETYPSQSENGNAWSGNTYPYMVTTENCPEGLPFTSEIVLNDCLGQGSSYFFTTIDGILYLVGDTNNITEFTSYFDGFISNSGPLYQTKHPFGIGAGRNFSVSSWVKKNSNDLTTNMINIVEERNFFISNMMEDLTSYNNSNYGYSQYKFYPNSKVRVYIIFFMSQDQLSDSDQNAFTKRLIYSLYEGNDLIILNDDLDIYPFYQTIINRLDKGHERISNQVPNVLLDEGENQRQHPSDMSVYPGIQVGIFSLLMGERTTFRQKDENFFGGVIKYKSVDWFYLAEKYGQSILCFLSDNQDFNVVNYKPQITVQFIIGRVYYITTKQRYGKFNNANAENLFQTFLEVTQCHPSCLDCDSLDLDICTICGSSRVLDSGKCICQYGYLETNTPECIEVQGTNIHTKKPTEFKIQKENLEMEITQYDPELDSVNVSEFDCYQSHSCMQVKEKHEYYCDYYFRSGCTDLCLCKNSHKLRVRGISSKLLAGISFSSCLPFPKCINELDAQVNFIYLPLIMLLVIFI